MLHQKQKQEQCLALFRQAMNFLRKYWTGLMLFLLIELKKQIADTESRICYLFFAFLTWTGPSSVSQTVRIFSVSNLHVLALIARSKTAVVGFWEPDASF